jgi:hypothetical protein
MNEDDYHDISEHDRTKSKSTTDIATLFKELTTSEVKDGISSVDLPNIVDLDNSFDHWESVE